jgi:hypothetical protein
VTSDGRPYARFRRALRVRSLLQAESAARELPHVGLLDALDYLALLAAEEPDRYDRGAKRWLSGLLAESQARRASPHLGRCFVPARGTTRPSSLASTGPRIRKSIRSFVAAPLGPS